MTLMEVEGKMKTLRPWPKGIVLFSLLISTLVLCTITHAAVPEQKKPQKAEADVKFITEFHKSTILMTSMDGNGTEAELSPFLLRPCLAKKIAEEKQMLLKRMWKPWNWGFFGNGNGSGNKYHVRYRTLMAIDGFRRYGERAERVVGRKREGFGRLKGGHIQILTKHASYQAKLASISRAIQQNAKIAEEIAEYAMRYYRISLEEVASFKDMIDSEGRSSDQVGVVQALKHFGRDWSVDGVEERGKSMRVILEMLEGLFADRDGKEEVRVLIPGAGVGRLGMEVEGLGGFEVHTNEYSSYMNLAHNYISSLTTPHSRTIHPYAETLSNQPSTAELLTALTFPDTISPCERIIHHEGDFTVLFKNTPKNEKFDVVITLFFIDTARNVLAYFETIKEVLKPGGKWINVGPLAYGKEAMVELGLEEVLSVLEGGMRFEFLDLGGLVVGEAGLGLRLELDMKNGWRREGGMKVKGWEARYGGSPRNLMRNGYEVQFWVVRTGGD